MAPTPREPHVVPTDVTATADRHVTERGIGATAVDTRAAGTAGGASAADAPLIDAAPAAVPQVDVLDQAEAVTAKAPEITGADRGVSDADRLTDSHAATPEDITTLDMVGARATVADTGASSLVSPHQELRRAIDAELAAMSSQEFAMGVQDAVLRNEIQKLAPQIRAAIREGKGAEHALYMRRKALTADLQGPPDWWQIHRRRLRALRASTELRHYKNLTASAARTADYLAVAAGQIDPNFILRGDPTTVEHLVPRWEIWQIPGFLENLSPRQQIAVFSYKPNLRRVPGPANFARGDTPYASLPSTTWRSHIKDQASLDILAADQAKMRKAIGDMIDDPASIK